jgi:ribosome-associated translation inhibitor RaiA
MEMTMKINWSGMSELYDSEQIQIEARLESLAEGHTDLIDVRITGHQTRHHNHGDKEVSIKCHARGRDIVVARTAPDLGLALNRVLDVIEREVHRMREKARSQRRVRRPEPTGFADLDRIDGDEG